MHRINCVCSWKICRTFPVCAICRRDERGIIAGGIGCRGVDCGRSVCTDVNSSLSVDDCCEGKISEKHVCKGADVGVYRNYNCMRSWNNYICFCM